MWGYDMMGHSNTLTYMVDMIIYQIEFFLLKTYNYIMDLRWPEI